MPRIEYKWGVLIAVIFGIFMVILDSTVVNVAFATLREEYGASIGDSQWIISIYVMALGISTPLSGYIADRFSPKRGYITGLTIFVIGSFCCGIAPNLGFLIAARAFQGFGGGIALPLGTALLFSAFKREEQGLALGVFGIALVVAPALGPILGGWLVDQDLWRWIFFINIPIGLTGIVMGTRFLRDQRSEHKPRLDWLGLIASTVGFGSTLYAASIASNEGWTSQRVLVFFGIGAVGLIALVVLELFVVKEPLLNLRLFRKPIFALATFVGWVSVLALFGAEFLLPLYLQTLRGKTALETGVILLPLAISAGIMTPLAGRFYDKIGPRPLMVTGYALLMLNTWQFSQLKADTPIQWILVLLSVRGFALGLTVQTTLVTALSTVEQREVARASALSNATRQVVQSIGVAVLATVLATTLSSQVKGFQAQVQNLPHQAGQQFALCDPNSAAAILPPTAPAGAAAQVQALLQTACTQSIQGFERAYQLTFFFALAALILGAFLPGWPFKWTGRRAQRGASSEAPPSEAVPV